MTYSINPIAISKAMEGVPGRTPATPAVEREAAFATLAPYRDGSITLGKFSGSSAWERHPKGDEIVHVVAGSIILRVDGGSSLKLTAGEVAVVPANRWHQIYAPEMASVLYVTPRPTIHFDGGDPTNRQFDPLSGRGGRLLSALMWSWSRLRRE